MKIIENIKNRKNLEEEKTKWLENLRWEDLPSHVQEEGKSFFYKNFDFMELYAPREPEGLMRFAPAVAVVLNFLLLIIVLFKK